MKKITILFLIAISSFIIVDLNAQTETAAELAKKLANPVANLISLPIQSNIDLGIGAYNGSRWTTNVQPVIPFQISEKLNLITRTILPITTQYNITGEGTNQAGLSDAVISAFLSPVGGNVIWGAGPVFLVPVGTNDFLTTKKWGVGPTAVVLKQSNGFTYGALANHVWSIGGDEARADVNQTYVYPFLGYNWKSGAGIFLNYELTQNWEAETTVQYLTPSFSGVTSFGSQKISVAVGPRVPIGSDTPGDFGLRGVITFLFPK